MCSIPRSVRAQLVRDARKDADPDISILKKAKAEYARLQ
jgi:hypothetical protein